MQEKHEFMTYAPTPLEGDIDIVQECLTVSTIDFEGWFQGMTIAGLMELEGKVLENNPSGKLSSYLRPYAVQHPLFAKLQETGFELWVQLV